MTHISTPRAATFRPHLMIASLALLAAGFLAFPFTVVAEEGEGGESRYALGAPPDPVFQTECSSCHMAFSPKMLSADSWKAVMAGLKDHFGENASLDPATTSAIETYLVANAAAPAGSIPRAMMGQDKTKAPLRITDTRWWISAHSEEVSPKAFANPKVGSKANCVACHAGAEKGLFGD